MGKVYNLYLDESLTHNGNYNDKVFVIAGIIVEESYAKINLPNDLNQVKKNIWGSHYPSNYQNLILHEKEIKEVFNKRIKVTKAKPHFQMFKIKHNMTILYGELEKIIRSGNITTLGVGVKLDEIGRNYDGDILNNQYYIALQIIIENFVHFLIKNNAVGRVIYEYNGEVKGLRMKYSTIKTVGTLFIKPEVIQERLLDIEFIEKKENNAGLQIADFIPNTIAQKIANKKLLKFNIYKTIKKYSYDGGVKNKDKFGIKVVK
jgi:hypothetical protein